MPLVHLATNDSSLMENYTLTITYHDGRRVAINVGDLGNALRALGWGIEAFGGPTSDTGMEF